jgi:hypothetical protein
MLGCGHVSAAEASKPTGLVVIRVDVVGEISDTGVCRHPALVSETGLRLGGFKWTLGTCPLNG